MAVGHTRRKPSAIARAEHFFAKVADQHDLALDYPNELIFGRVPMALACPLAGRHAREVDAELS